METLKQSLKIGASLAAMIGLALVVIPERPTLLADATDARAHAPVDIWAARAPEPARENEAEEAEAPLASTPASPSGEEENAAAGEPEGALPPAAETQQSADAPLEQPAAEEPPAGELHLQRLRGETASSEIPAEEPSAETAFDEAAIAPPALEDPPAENVDAPAEVPAEEEFAAPADAPPEETEGGGAGLDSLRQTAEAVQFRLLSSPEAADSGTISAGDQAVRLSGVVPVPSQARCADGARCGEQAREAVQSWLSGRALLCAVSPTAGDEAVAPCLMGEEDVGQWIVANGWAEAEPGSRYVGAEERARAQGLGIWASGGR